MGGDSAARHLEASPLPLLVVIGPTGAGKSACAIAMAQAAVAAQPGITPHIINADVSQMYSGLPIATNQPVSDSDTAGFAHHLVGQLRRDEAYNVRRFVHDAIAVMRRLDAEERQPLFIVCGGTHYYVQGLLFGDQEVDESESPPDADHAKTSALAKSVCLPGETPQQALQRLDAAEAQRWHPNDTQRIERLLARAARPTARRHREDGSTSEGHGTVSFRREAVRGGRPPLIVTVDEPDRARLEERHRVRAERMVERGLLQEVAAAQAAGPGDYLRRAIGFHEFEGLLGDPAEYQAMREGRLTEKGKAALDELVRDTRRYALQQQQWVRNRFCKRYGSVIRDTALVVRSGSAADGVCRALLRAWLTGEASSKPNALDSVDGAQRLVVEGACDGGASEPADRTVHRCEPCGKSLCGKEQLEAHLRSRKHRNVVKRAAERRQRPPSQGGTGEDLGEQRRPDQPRSGDP